ncbi:MAG TPA: FG-GAP repeat protein, partial [Polyangiaceae bacterium]|nr:FG-GAP repeat protein [Polyangiaceae bacterium]
PPALANAGAVYVYELDAAGEHWQRVIKLTAGDEAAANDFFGSSIALEGNTLAVGAPGADTADNDGAPESGAVYVFEGKDWLTHRPLQLLPRRDNIAGYQMGAVALSGGRLLCGAPAAEGNGLAFLFERDPNGVWQAPQTLAQPADVALPNAQFGLGVAIDGDIAAVTRRVSNDNGGVFIYRREVTQPGPQVLWKLRRTWNSTAVDSTGWAAGVRGPAVFVGATHQTPSGAAYAFNVPLQAGATFPSEAPP